MDIIYENGSFLVLFFFFGKICCRPTVTQLNMEFSNEK